MRTEWHRGLAAVAGGIVALALAGPAQANHATPTVEALASDDGCTVTIAAVGELHVTSATVTAGLAVRVDGVTEVHRGGLPATNGAHPFAVEETYGPFDEATTVSWLLFGGPEGLDDQPAQGDRVAVDAHLNGDGPDSYIEWYTVEVPACPADPEPTPTPAPTVEPTAGPTAAPSEPAASGDGGELAQTGIPARGIAGIGVVLLLAGTAGVVWARRRPIEA